MPSNRIRLGLLALPFVVSATMTSGAYAAGAPKGAVIETNMGTIEIRFESSRAPLSVANFVRYAEEGHYDGTIFHRVIDGFMIQGGGFTADMKQKPTHSPIVNEARGGLSNQRGTVAFARTNDPHSATCQFFINLVDNDFLDASKARDGWGYTVFARVTKGMDVVDRIGAVKTTNRRGMSDVPQKNGYNHIRKDYSLTLKPLANFSSSKDLRPMPRVKPESPRRQRFLLSAKARKTPHHTTGFCRQR